MNRLFLAVLRPGVNRSRPGRPGILVLLLALAGCTTVTTQQLAEEYFNLGNAYFELGRYEESFAYYSRAVELSDTIPAAGYNLVRLHEQREEWALALGVLADLRTSDPDNTLYRETEAFLRYRNGEITPARVLYAELIAEYPQRLRLAYNLGLLELAADEAALAWEALETAYTTALEDEDAAYIWLAAEASWLTGREEQALARLEVYRELSADQPDQLGDLAARFAAWGFPLAALELLREIPATVDGDADLLFLSGRLYLEATEDFERGVESLVAAISAGYATDSEAYVALLERLPEDERAILQERVQALSPED